MEVYTVCVSVLYSVFVCTIVGNRVRANVLLCESMSVLSVLSGTHKYTNFA